MKKKILNPYSYSHNFFFFLIQKIFTINLSIRKNRCDLFVAAGWASHQKKKNRCSRAMEREEQSETITLDDTGNE